MRDALVAIAVVSGCLVVALAVLTVANSFWEQQSAEKQIKVLRVAEESVGRLVELIKK